ncbi:MAG: hypothetical protein IKM02_05340 [Clostridia bacterium]|nr:hypothetical protein [Clostridia bacterium]
MTFNFLAILLSIAMMLTGGAGIESDGPIASSLTICDVYFEYNDTSFELEPSLTAGVMTDNGTAVFDLSMQSGGEALFPMQLVISEDAATLVAEKAGKAFTIDAETLNGIIDEALDLDMLLEDEEFQQAVETLETSFGTALSMEDIQADEEAINALVYEKLQPAETVEESITYDEKEYQVTSKRYVLDNDQMFELIDGIYASSEELSAMYNDLLDNLNETLAMEVEEGEEVPEITSIKQLYDQLGMSISMDLTESVSADGEFTAAAGTITLAQEELPEPIVISIESYEMEGVSEALVETGYTIDDMELILGVSAYEGDGEQYFELACEVSPLEETDDSADAFAFYMAGGSDINQDGLAEYGFNMELSADEMGFAFMIDGSEDEEGGHSIDISFEYADEYDNVAAGLTLVYSKAVFENAAEGLAPIAIDPENLENAEAEAMGVAESLMADLQMLAENESVAEMLEAFTAINSVGAETVEVEVADANGEYTLDEAEPTPTELTFDEPEFAYIPEGMTLDDAYIDVEYNNASYTIADEDYANVFYVYVYGNPYSTGQADYVLSEDGVMTAIDDRVVSVTTDEDAIYADIQDGDINISVSYYGEDMDVEEVGKILAGMKY